MSLSGKKNFSIYKAKQGVVDQFLNSEDSLDDHILGLLNERKAKTKQYSSFEVQLDDDVQENWSISLSHRVHSSHSSWNTILQSLNQGIDALSRDEHDFIISVFNGEAIYFVSGGYAYNDLIDFVDINFPLELLKRIVDPSAIKAAKSRALTGQFFAKDLYFRGPASIAGVEGFGQVWKEVHARLDEDFLNDPDIVSIFGSVKKINVTTKANFQIKRKIDFAGLLSLIEKLHQYLQRVLDPDVKHLFSFLDGVELVRSGQLKAKLAKHVSEICLDNMVNDTRYDFDVSHRNYEKYFSADVYVLIKDRSRLQEFQHEPTYNEIIDVLNSEVSDLEELGKVNLKSEHELEYEDTSGSFNSHLHGEIELENQKYFLIDGDYYRVNTSFLDFVKRQYDTRIINGCLSDQSVLSSLTLNSGWLEADYNEGFVNDSGVIVGDRFLYKNIELFDLLAANHEEKKIYVFQNKIGIGAGTRDACSQIRNAANIISQMQVERDDTSVKDLFSKISVSNVSYAGVKISEQTGMLGEDDFVNLFRGEYEIIYVLNLLKTDIDKVKQTESNIAKFEILSLEEHLKTKGASLIILATNLD